MDKHLTHQVVETEKLAIAMYDGCNVQLHTDGGMRPGAGASIGWTVTIWQQNTTTGNWQTSRVGKGCAYIQGCQSSFLAEALALEFAIDMFASLISESAVKASRVYST